MVDKNKTELKIFITSNLILNVNKNCDPKRFNSQVYLNFLDVLCTNREYQKEAILSSLFYLFGGEYNNVEALIQENYAKNQFLQDKYPTLDKYLANIKIPNKLSGVIDLATGTGKSYIMFGIAQIALHLGYVDKVLILCPSVTIESDLIDKFTNLASNKILIDSISNNPDFAPPNIISANSTIKNGDICIENIHAIYENTGSSISDSLKGKGERVLVLNDEIHHAYNPNVDKDINKWLNFLNSSEYNFHYILGFTGTAYLDNDYFNNVIYRYSIKQGIEQNFIKSVEYVHEIEGDQTEEARLSVIYENQEQNKLIYNQIKPLTILITKDIKKCKSIKEEFIDFLVQKKGLTEKIAESKVLIVTSHQDHKKNLPLLKQVDDRNNSVEFIFSVSMLTEGWDVKNVFQIVPREERAFNSKLLISQVLGRGLRIPQEYAQGKPKVIVFNHDKFAKKIKDLFDEITEVETRIKSEVNQNSEYNFSITKLKYQKQPQINESQRDVNKPIDYRKGYANLVAQNLNQQTKITYQALDTKKREKIYNSTVEYKSFVKIASEILQSFKNITNEAKIILPDIEVPVKVQDIEINDILNYIKRSATKVGITTETLDPDNEHRIRQAFSTLLRTTNKTIHYTNINDSLEVINTNSLSQTSIGIGSLRSDESCFFKSNYSFDEESVKIIKELEERSDDAPSEHYDIFNINYHIFKSPLSIILTSKGNEKKFVKNYLLNQNYSNLIESFIKSTNTSFYEIDYTVSRGKSTKSHKFNPDFFIKSKNYIFVVEIKADGDDNDDNKAKLKYAREYFSNLNDELKISNVKEKYFFHFISPKSYQSFFDTIKTQINQDDGFDYEFSFNFRSDLEDKLES